MPDHRFQKMFSYDYNCFEKTWCHDVKTILQQIQMSYFNENKLSVNLKDVEDVLFAKYKTDWYGY
jgi:hypothetical protein